MSKLVVRKLLSLCLSLVLVSTALPLQATVLIELTLEELVEQSALVFAGKVLNVVVSSQDDLVYTTVLFQVDTVIKGSLDQEQLELRFLGGKDTAVTIAIAGQFYPTVNEQGLYFVTDPTQELVNPLTGWGQGYFPTFTGDDGTTYLDLRNHPHYAFLDGGQDPLLEKMRALKISETEIKTHFPKSQQYPLADFLAAITYLLPK